MTTYRISDGPSHQLQPGPGRLQGFYRIELVDDAGRRSVRYLTDKQRAEVLRRLDAGRRELSVDELDELSVEPDVGALTARLDAEAGEGG